MEPTPVSLTTICGGAAEEVFQREMAELLKNITDPSTDPDRKRRITLVFDFKPMADRASVEVEFACLTKLAPVTILKASMYVGRKGGALHAYTLDAKQQPLFEAAAPAEAGSEGSERPPAKLVPLKK